MASTPSPDARIGGLLGLAAAASFGLSAPLAKLLLRDVGPVLLAGLLYLGAAAGLWLHRAVVGPSREAPLRRGDLGRLAVVVAAGGVAGPILMLAGLDRVTGLTGALVLNLEAPFTLLLAVAFFGEHLGRGAAVAAGLIMAGAAALDWTGGVLGGQGLGVALLAAACAAWALDNNLTQGLTLKDPFALVRIKTLAAGLTNTALGLALGDTLPAPHVVGLALALGSVSYGLSVVLDALALRRIGAAREAAYFATAPFVGATGAFLLLGDVPRSVDLVAMAAMAAGVALLLRERHAHEHVHEPMDHEHLHHHDAHHQHAHGPDDPPGEPHSHPHHHTRLVHDHPHVPDAHHRHAH